jgi:hypothetical protein
LQLVKIKIVSGKTTPKNSTPTPPHTKKNNIDSQSRPPATANQSRPLFQSLPLHFQAARSVIRRKMADLVTTTPSTCELAHGPLRQRRQISPTRAIHHANWEMTDKVLVFFTHFCMVHVY